MLGGTGFVGRHLCAELAQHGHQLTIPTRNREQNRELLVLPTAQVVESDIHNESQLDKLFQDQDVVVNLVGILNEKGHRGTGFHVAHVELARKVVNACLYHKIQKLLHMSALNAAPDANSFYLRTKGEAENYVHTFATNNLAVISFRPSVIFGTDDDFINRFANILKLVPLIFPLACGKTKFAPVSVGDVVRHMVIATEGNIYDGQRLNLCGPHTFSLAQIVKQIAQAKNYAVFVFALPNWLSKLQARILEFMPGKPLSIDNYNSLQTDSVCEDSLPCNTPLSSILQNPTSTKFKKTRLKKIRAKRA